MDIKRVFLIVLDSLGIGELPDAKKYNDVGSNTLKSISNSSSFSTPTLEKFGLFNIDGVDFGKKVPAPVAAYGRASEKSLGKDTTTGHWEICGLVLDSPFPTFPNGFPKEIIDKFSKATGRKVLCNKPYSGTQVIKDYGEEHIKTGGLIVYTSADSVFQIAAHEDVVPIEQLYEYCKIARKILCGESAVGRVIARPFIGEYPNFVRTANRHDFSLTPFSKTLLNFLNESGFDTISVGKINDIFNGFGISESIHTVSNDDGMNKTSELLNKDFHGLCFVNLVDFDSKYGHRNDIDGYAKALSDFDSWLGNFYKQLNDNDLLIITADHGCDPGTESTDHSREYIPILVYGKSINPTNLGTLKSYSDIGKTIADIFNIKNTLFGKSFLTAIF